MTETVLQAMSYVFVFAAGFVFGKGYAYGKAAKMIQDMTDMWSPK